MPVPVLTVSEEEFPITERLLLIHRISRFMCMNRENNGPAVSFDFARLIFPAIAMGRIVFMSPNLKSIRILQKESDLWSDASHFVQLKSNIEVFYEVYRLHDQYSCGAEGLQNHLKKIGFEDPNEYPFRLTSLFQGPGDPDIGGQNDLSC